MTFKYLDNSLAKAFELAVLEYPFGFWQWGGSCNEIPVNVSIDSALSYFLKESGIDLFADKAMKQYEPHYYQAATQMGYYGYNIEPFKKYLTQFKSNPLASFTPKEAGKSVYDNTLNEKTYQWLKEHGDRMIFIYGGKDTWSADRMILPDKIDSKIFVISGANHGTARIKNMSKDMRNNLIEAIKKWTSLKAVE